MIPELTRIKSTNIYSIGYDEINSKLYIKFKTNKKTTYVYKNVPISIYQSLCNSKSKGTYHSEYIKDKYEFIKINQ